MAQPTLDQQPPDEADATAAVAGLLAVGASAAATAATAHQVLAAYGIPLKALVEVFRVALSAPIGVGRSSTVLPGWSRGVVGGMGRPVGAVVDRISDPGGGPAFESPSSRSRKAERTYRAAFVVNSAKRVARGLREGKTLEQLLPRERQLFQQHLDAQDRRVVAAALVDEAAKAYGPVLGWYAELDDRTSPECRAADGANFRADRRPRIGYPGTVHPHCRCRAGAPWPTSATVDSQVTRWMRRRGGRRAA